MPAVIAHSSRRRRSMSEINMVPFIDVMLVLLIIFMVTAPMITTGMVDLPSVGRSSQRPPQVVEVIVGADERLKLRVNQGDSSVVGLGQLATKVKELQAGNADSAVVISADKSVRYEQVVKVMDALQRAGIQRIGLSVKQTG
ncbi:MAG TPA: protein TolR [Burkholderiaceae bacterium]